MKQPSEALNRLRSIPVAWFAEELLPQPSQGVDLLQRIPHESASLVQQIIERYPAEVRPITYRWLLWFAKCGLIQIHP